MTTNRRIINYGLAAFLGLTVIVAAGCSKAASTGSAGASPAPEKKLTEIRLPTTLSDLAIVADKKGYFAEEGVKIVWTGKQAHGPANIISIVAGQNDAGMSIDTAIIDGISKGNKIKLVTAAGNSPLIHWYVKKDSGITKPEDLIGKKVAGQSGTITWYPLVKYLSDKGLDYNKIEFVTLPAPQQEQALLSGQVAAIAVADPFAAKLAKNPDALKLTDDYEILGIKKIGGYAFSDDFIARNPEAVKGFVRALIKAVDFIQASDANFAEGQKYALDGGGNGLQKDWDPTVLLDKADIDAWISLQEKYGTLKPGSVKAEDVFTNEFNPNAK